MDRFESVKDVSALPSSLKEIVCFQVVDNKIEAITVNYNGESIRIVVEGTYSTNLKVLKEQEKQKVSKYNLKGKYAGLVEVDEIFDSLHDAQNRLSEFERTSGYNLTGLGIVEITVLVDKTNF